jgi:fucose 4-O-acetylase-like acetyltransferase
MSPQYHDAPSSLDNKSDARISALSGIGITTVVFGHSQVGSAADSAPGTDSLYAVWVLAVRWIYSFHMPLFFAVSGFLLLHATLRGGRSGYPPYAASLSKRALRILLPYVLISTLVFPIKVVMSEHALRPVTFTLRALIENLVLPWNNVILFFWFLPTLFVMFALAPLLLEPRRDSPRRDAAVMLACLAAYFWFPHSTPHGLGSFLNLSGMLHNYLYFALGFMVRKYWRVELPDGRLSAPLLFCASWAMFLLLPTTPATTLLQALTGCAMAAMLALSGPRVVEPMSRIGRYSFQIYLLSWFPQTLLRAIGSRLVDYPSLFVPVAACSVAVGLLVPILLTRLAQARIPRRYLVAIGV